MKQFLLKGILGPTVKSTDPDFADLKNAVMKAAKDQNTKASLKLLRGGDATLKVEDDAVGDQIVGDLEQLPGVTVSGYSTATGIYVQQRLQKQSVNK